MDAESNSGLGHTAKVVFMKLVFCDTGWATTCKKLLTYLSSQSFVPALQLLLDPLQASVLIFALHSRFTPNHTCIHLSTHVEASNTAH